MACSQSGCEQPEGVHTVSSRDRSFSPVVRLLQLGSVGYADKSRARFSCHARLRAAVGERPADDNPGRYRRVGRAADWRVPDRGIDPSPRCKAYGQAHGRSSDESVKPQRPGRRNIAEPCAAQRYPDCSGNRASTRNWSGAIGGGRFRNDNDRRAAERASSTRCHCRDFGRACPTGSRQSRKPAGRRRPSNGRRSGVWGRYQTPPQRTRARSRHRGSAAGREQRIATFPNRASHSSSAGVSTDSVDSGGP